VYHCVPLSYIMQHQIVLIIFLPILLTITIAQMMSTGGKGLHSPKNSIYVLPVHTTTKKLSVTYFGARLDLTSDKLYTAPDSSSHFLQALPPHPAESSERSGSWLSSAWSQPCSHLRTGLNKTTFLTYWQSIQHGYFPNGANTQTIGPFSYIRISLCYFCFRWQGICCLQIYNRLI